MKIAIDGRYLFGPRRGIGIYSLNLLNNLSLLKTNNIFYVFGLSKFPPNDLKLSKNLIYIHTPYYNYLIWENFIFPYFANKNRCELIHYLGNTSSFYNWFNLTKVVTIHDVSYMYSRYNKFLKFKSIKSLLGYFYRKINFKYSIRNTNSIITVSDFARKDILKFIRKSVPVYVINNGLSDIFLKRKSINKRNSITLISGNSFQKNFKLIEDTLVNSDFLSENNLTLDIIGITKTSRNPNVNFFGFKDQDFISKKLSSSKYFILPSFYESFAIPVLEALSLDNVIICSKNGAPIDILRQNGIFFNPNSNLDFIDKLSDAIENYNDYFLEIKKSKSILNDYSWSKAAKITNFVYEKSFN